MNEEERIIRSIKYIINQNYVDTEDDIIGILIKALNLIEKQSKEIEEFKNADLYEANNRINDLLDLVKQKDEAIKILLTAFEKEKEDNKELRKYYATRKEVEELREINECLHDSAENYVHKDKIIAKVIEIKDRPVKDEFITATQGKLNTIIDIESLLDKEE